jgi:hypothetical protein
LHSWYGAGVSPPTPPGLREKQGKGFHAPFPKDRSACGGGGCPRPSGLRANGAGLEPVFPLFPGIAEGGIKQPAGANPAGDPCGNRSSSHFPGLGRDDRTTSGSESGGRSGAGTGYRPISGDWGGTIKQPAGADLAGGPALDEGGGVRSGRTSGPDAGGGPVAAPRSERGREPVGRAAVSDGGAAGGAVRTGGRGGAGGVRGCPGRSATLLALGSRLEDT